MAGTYYAFDGLLRQPAAADCLRAAAGIWIPNHGFRHANASIYTGTKAGDDGIVWNLSRFRNWYYVGNEPGDPYGSNTGARNPFGFLDAASLYMATTATTTGQSISTDHKVLAQTIHTDYLDFARVYQGHFDKAVTLALVVDLPTDVTIGTDLKAYLACYDSDGEFITAGTHDSGTGSMTEANPAELVFDQATEAGTGNWQRLTAHTASVLPDNTHYVMLHIGLKSPDAANTGISIADCALMLNVADGSTAEDSFDPWIDLDPVELRIGSAMAWEALGATSRVMLDGRRLRSMAIKDSLKARFSALFTKTSAEAYQQLMTIWNLSVRGLGHYVPEPVPVCIDFGLGQLPFFGYYNVVRASFDGSFSPHWQFADSSEAYDIALELEEA